MPSSIPSRTPSRFPFRLVSVVSATLAGLLSQPALAQTTSTSSETRVQVPTQLKTDKNQYFALSAAGLRDYMATLQSEKPGLYLQLKPAYQRVRKRSTAGWTMVGTGTGAMLVGSSLLVGSRVSDPYSNRYFAASMIMACSGLALAGAGFLTLPRARQYRDFVNQHNRLNPEDPLKVTIGLAASPEGGAATVNLRF